MGPLNMLAALRNLNAETHCKAASAKKVIRLHSAHLSDNVCLCYDLWPTLDTLCVVRRAGHSTSLIGKLQLALTILDKIG